MKFSESWLRSLVNPPCVGSDFSRLLTMAGLEVESEECVAPVFDQVIVVQILEVEKHPDADRLQVCRVDLGAGETAQIVCGASNAAVGRKVPCALPGGRLPGGLTIKLTKVRGVASAGMLCSAKELGIADDAAGLLILADDAPVGADIRGYLDLDDRLLLLKLTPNRADCLSLEGVAREVAALTGSPARYIEVAAVKPRLDLQRRIVLEAPEACPLYCGRIISGVDARATTPSWMRQRLERSGLRSISALVDITNYVMLELGQPLHAFDNTHLDGDIRVRFAHSGERLRLLNEQTLTLNDDTLLITDNTKPLALAGIMGGEDSGITLDTRELFLEAAFFSPKAIAGRARRYGFGSDASHRFERGVDFGGTQRALERASQLVLEICGGRAGPLCQTMANLPARRPVRLRASRAGKILGIPFSTDRIAELLTRFGLPFKQIEDEFLITPPTYRFDMEIEEDLVEEIARLHGYENIPSPRPQGGLTMLSRTETQRPLAHLRQILVNNGYQEVINFAFVDETWEIDFADNQQLIRLANPIANQLSVLRSTLIAGLVANLATNLKRRQTRVRLFETGRCFYRDEQGGPVPGFSQPWRLAALAYGPALPEQWASPVRNSDFFDMKGDLERLLAPKTARFERAMHPALHPGRSARIIVDERTVGIVGELHPQWQQKYELPLAPSLFELDLSSLLDAQLPQYTEVSRQPPAIRDLAIVVQQTIELNAIYDGIQSNCPKLVREISLFDVYTGHGIETGKKSLAFRILMQDTQKTLLEADVDKAMQALTTYLQETFAAQLRV